MLRGSFDHPPTPTIPTTSHSQSSIIIEVPRLASTTTSIHTIHSNQSSTTTTGTSKCLTIHSVAWPYVSLTFSSSHQGPRRGEQKTGIYSTESTMSTGTFELLRTKPPHLVKVPSGFVQWHGLPVLTFKRRTHLDQGIRNPVTGNSGSWDNCRYRWSSFKDTRIVTNAKSGNLSGGKISHTWAFIHGTSITAAQCILLEGFIRPADWMYNPSLNVRSLCFGNRGGQNWPHNPFICRSGSPGQGWQKCPSEPECRR